MQRTFMQIIDMLVGFAESAPVERWRVKNFANEWVAFDVLRLDALRYGGDAMLSGNKIFKLLPNLWLLQSRSCRTVASPGGPWSNHLWSLSAAAKHFDLIAIGLINGERPENLTPTLFDARDQGMALYFLSRKDFKQIQWTDWQYNIELQQNDDKYLNRLSGQYDRLGLLPSGANNLLGLFGGFLLGDVLERRFCNHRWLCAAGSGTLACGLAFARSTRGSRSHSSLSETLSSKPQQRVCAFSLIEQPGTILERNRPLLSKFHLLCADFPHLASDLLEHDIDLSKHQFDLSRLELIFMKDSVSQRALHYKQQLEAGASPEDLVGAAIEKCTEESSQQFRAVERADLESVYLLPMLRYLAGSLSMHESSRVVPRDQPLLLIHGGGQQADRLEL